MRIKFKPLLQISNRLDFFCGNLEVRSGGCFIRGVRKKGLELEFSKLEFHVVFNIFLKFFKNSYVDYFWKLEFQLKIEFNKLEVQLLWVWRGIKKKKNHVELKFSKLEFQTIKIKFTKY